MLSWRKNAIGLSLLILVIFLFVPRIQTVLGQCSIYGCAACNYCGGDEICHACAPAAGCVTTCGTDPYYPANGCCGTYYCAGQPDHSAPPVPSLSSTTSNCSGSISFSWAAVSDVGCYGNVDYYLQVKDTSGFWYRNSWNSTSPFTISPPIVGRVYQAQILSSDNGANHTNQSAWSGGALWTTGVPYCCSATAAALAPLSPNATCNGPTVPSTYTWTADSNASGYLLNITGCVVNQAVVGGTTNSYTLTAAQQTACNALATGSVSWSVQATYAGGCSNSPAASASFNFDRTAPPKPVDSVELIQDVTCLGKYTAKYSWTAVNDAGGCAGNATNPYWAQASSNSGFSSVLFGWDNTWSNVLTQSSAQSYAPGTTLYFHVQAHDAVDNQSGWTTTISRTIPTPSPLPTIHVDGPLVEDVSGTCYGGMTIDTNSLTLQPAINPAAGVTPICTKTSTSYSCNLIIDNQTGQCFGNTIQVQMSGSYPGYGVIGWRAGEACAGAPSSLTFAPGDSQTSVPLFFAYGGSDPGDGNWFKLSKSSFNSRLSGRHNYIPNTITTYDGTGDDSTANRNMMINSSGVLVQNSPVLVGAGTVTYSSNNWFTSGYQYTNDVSYQKYVDYLKARKDFKTITNLTEITGDGVYSISAPVTLSSTQFDGKKVVLVVDGAGATTFGANFIPVGGSVAVLGKNIVIDAATTEIDAIVIGETISTGIATGGLKIKGNIIDESAIQIERVQSDARKPSLFVVFDPKIYLDVLPYLSTSTYDWRQVQ